MAGREGVHREHRERVRRTGISGGGDKIVEDDAGRMLAGAPLQKGWKDTLVK